MGFREDADRLRSIYQAALAAADSYQSVRRNIDEVSRRFDTGRFRRLIVTAFGKAACPMAKALEKHSGLPVEDGIVLTKYGHCPEEHRPRDMRVFEAGHPVPDENGVNATREIVRLAREAGGDTMIICLVSGGGSSLLVAPREGISLEEKRRITGMLLSAGADIFELNAVRKHLSAVKGGRLASLSYPASVFSLVISDVIGDRLDVIASGPTSPDSSTYADALAAIHKYGLKKDCPETVCDLLERGASGMLAETPKEGDVIFRNAENIIISNSSMALEGAKAAAEILGLHAEIISAAVSGEAREAGRWLAARALEVKGAPGFRGPVVLISGGETTVNVRGKGEGGRNMEVALSFAIHIAGNSGITMLSAGTDGTDGPTVAAGAIVDGDTVRRAIDAGIEPEEYLMNNDSYNFFRKTGGLFVTGPTGTNVMDVQITLVR